MIASINNIVVEYIWFFAENKGHELKKTAMDTYYWND